MGVGLICYPQTRFIDINPLIAELNRHPTLRLDIRTLETNHRFSFSYMEDLDRPVSSQTLGLNSKGQG